MFFQHTLFRILVATAALPLWAGNDPTDYPLRLQIAAAAQTISNGSVFVQGKATLSDPAANTMSAIDYSGTCSFSFQTSPTSAGLTNPAKWKKEGTKLTVLWTRHGSADKFDKCDFDIGNTLPHKAYVTAAGGVRLVSEDQLKSQQRANEAMQHDLNPTDTDPAHYPLGVLILGANWQQGQYGFNGQGKGNVFEKGLPRAIDFSANCASRPTGGLGTYYPGKWVEGNSRLLLLMHVIGEKNQFRQCELKTELRTFVYFLNSDTGVIKNMTQEEYKDWRDKRKDAQKQVASQPSESPAKVGASQKLSIASSPAGADIEVDGSFMGSTPSVIEINVGEHNIVVRKTGYKSWERKLKLTGGDIKVSAELERIAPK